jgi:ribosomal protein S18 acetylase RimI-like enzyme
VEFRRSVESDISPIMNIITQAQENFKAQGIDQWQNNYPNPAVIKADIDKGYSYVLLKEEKIAATAAVSFDGERTYKVIYEGQWLSEMKYAVIHRIAVDSSLKGQGLASIIIKHVEKMCLNRGVHSIKVDTHKDNISMQKLLEKNGFQYCGIILLEDKSERLAYEKLL